MRLLLLLSKQDLALSQAEAEAVFRRKGKRIGNVLLIEGEMLQCRRLAYTKQAYQHLFEATAQDLSKKIARFSWRRVYRKSFAVRVHNSAVSERELADIIWKRLSKPKVDLRQPETLIAFFFAKKMVHAGKLVWENDEWFEQRRPHLRPGHAPTSMHPRLARALVNLTGIRKGMLLDPFCGTGGILVEAGLMGLRPVGYDTNRKILARCRANLSHFRIKGCQLRLEDARNMKRKYDWMATDLPYGRNSPIPKRLYHEFLTILKRFLGKQAVLMMPNTIPAASIKAHGFQVLHVFDLYVHRNLTRRIFVVRISAVRNRSRAGQNAPSGNSAARSASR